MGKIFYYHLEIILILFELEKNSIIPSDFTIQESNVYTNVLKVVYCILTFPYQTLTPVSFSNWSLHLHFLLSVNRF